MKTAYDMTRKDLEELVDCVQRFLYGRYREVGGNDIDFLDSDKEFSGADLQESISIALDHYDLIPTLGSRSAEWQSATLRVCDGCFFALEQGFSVLCDPRMRMRQRRRRRQRVGALGAPTTAVPCRRRR